MEPIEQLKARLAILEKQVAEERKRDDEKRKEINNNPEMVETIKERTENGKKLDAVKEKERKLERRILNQFLMIDDQHYSRTVPSFYHKTSNWGQQTNIRNEVLFQIDCHSPLYLLTNDDVTDAVKRLINKAIDQFPALTKLRSEIETLGAIDSRLYEREHALDKELRAEFSSDSKVYGLQKEINELAGQIANPKKASEQEKRNSKRNEARNNLYNPAIINEIYNKLKIKIPKGEK